MYSRQHALYVLIVAFFALVSTLGSPFLYAEKSSGRYLLPVLKAADHELFQNDKDVESLTRFRSAFYDALAIAFQTTGATPQSLEPTMYALYFASKVLLVLLIFGIARALAKDVWLFMILAAWCCHQKSSPVGGVSLFVPWLTHGEVAFILGLLAIYFLFQERHILFWLILCLSVVIHPLVLSHLFICVVPPLLLVSKKVDRRTALGLISFVVSSFLYLHFMAPPSMSAEEARIFWEAKGGINHVSLLNQSLPGWLKMSGLVAVALLAHRHFTRSDRNSTLLAWSVLSGTFFSLLLSVIAVVSKSARLAQFQPMRTFLWVTLFANLLLAIATVRALRQSLSVGILLFAVIVLTILNSLWSMVFIFLGIGYFLAMEHPSLMQPMAFWRLETLVNVSIALTVGGMFLAWGLGEKQPFESFRNPVPLIPGFILLLTSSKSIIESEWRWVLVSSLIVYSLVGESICMHNYYASRLDSDWVAVRRWCEHHTAKIDRFITQPGASNFRTLSLRTTLSERMSALAWVDPTQYIQNRERANKVSQGHNGTVWNLEFLFSFAKEWDVDYAIVKGPYEPDVAPVFRSGPYTVLKVQ